MRIVAAVVALHALLYGQDVGRIQKLRAEAKAAFDREMAREKAGDCKDANTMREIHICLSRQYEITFENYKQFTGVIRALLASQGQPEFDQAEAAWQKYREAQCAAAYALFKGGTIAPGTQLSCNLLLVRSHLRELAAVYDSTLNY
jgi:uncharacterized protein YecT (DUF1311 family)